MSTITNELITICRLFAAFEKEQVCCGTVSVAQCVVLQSLLDGPAEASVLAEESGASRSSMSRLLDGLESKGWVVRTRDQDDRRRVTLALTKAGRVEAKRLRDSTEHLVESWLERIPKNKRQSVAESISLVRQLLESCRKELGCC